MPWWGWVLLAWGTLIGVFVWGWMRFLHPIREHEESRWPFMQEDGSR